MARHARSRATRRLSIDGESVVGREFVDLDVDVFTAARSEFRMCRFVGGRITTAMFGAGGQASLYEDCVFDGAVIGHGDGRARFFRCSFRGVELSDWETSAIEMVDCVFSGRLRGMVFYGQLSGAYAISTGQRIVRMNEFRGNDFSEADLDHSAFRFGIDLAAQRLPDGPDYVYLADTTAAVRRVRPVVERWEHPRRREGEFMLDLLDREVSHGQVQTLIRHSEWQTRPGYGDVIELLAVAAGGGSSL